MSDGRYPPQHGHSSHSGAYQDTYYANGYPPLSSSSPGSTRSPRQSMSSYGHAPRHDASNVHHPSYPAGYPHPGRPLSPNSQAQLAYQQHPSSRPRSSSITMPQHPAQNYMMQPPPRSSTPSIHAAHQRSHSQTQASLHNAAMRNHAASAYPHGGYPQSPSSPPPLQAGQAYPQSNSQYPASPTRPFPCDMCALSFNRQHDLKRHKETHSGERPYLCNGGCGKTFTRKDALKRHQLVKGCGNNED